MEDTTIEVAVRQGIKEIMDSIDSNRGDLSDSEVLTMKRNALCRMAAPFRSMILMISRIDGNVEGYATNLYDTSVYDIAVRAFCVYDQYLSDLSEE